MYMLDALLSNEKFRTELLLETFRDFVHQQQFYHWRHLRRDPLKDAEQHRAKTQATAAAADVKTEKSAVSAP